MKGVLTLWILLAGTAATAPVRAQEFDHLDVNGHRIATTHGLALRFTVPSQLQALGETHFRESYGGPSFDVSATAFASDSVLLAVHAETHTDGSGGLDYSEYPADTLAGWPLHSRIDCFDLREVAAEHVEGNGFLRFLHGAGFDFDRALVLKRHYLVNEEGTAEVVLSYGRTVDACGSGEVPPDVATEVSLASRRAFADLQPD
jgi:hypothetical protein